MRRPAALKLDPSRPGADAAPVRVASTRAETTLDRSALAQVGEGRARSLAFAPMSQYSVQSAVAHLWSRPFTRKLPRLGCRPLWGRKEPTPRIRSFRCPASAELVETVICEKENMRVSIDNLRPGRCPQRWGGPHAPVTVTTRSQS